MKILKPIEHLPLEDYLDLEAEMVKNVQEPVFTKLAERYGKSNAQIILRWHTQVGNVVIPGSKNVDHIRDNINIFDFVLTDEELAEIAALDRNAPYYVATPEALSGYLNFAPNFDEQE